MTDFNNILQTLLLSPENEVVEFKEAKNSFDVNELGKYFSALSNEANLRGTDFAWLVSGVADKTREIVGTSFKNSEQSLNKLKNDMAQHTTGNHIFREIATVCVDGKRVLLFQIPATPRNIVMCWKNIAYGRYGESLKPLDQGKQDEIRNQPPTPDWSAEPVPNATLADLDDMALAKARIMFKKVHGKIPPEEIDGWNNAEFLRNSGVMAEGKLTRAALLLLGKPEAAVKLRPAVAEITWALNDENKTVIDYEHFTIPFIITVDNVLAKIRNLTMRELPGGTLFPDTMKQYDDYSIREALHNCIAHQDYRMQQRISFVETPGYLYYANGGSFAPGTVENVLENIGPQRYYRNRCLCQAMYNYNMIDTIGRGIKKMYTLQRERFFPMPDYEIDNVRKEVVVKIYGKTINENYAKLLKDNHSLSLQECIWLDAVQKHKPVTPLAIRHLKAHGLIEGRSPNYTISLSVAQITHQLPHYNKVKGLEKERLFQMIGQFVSSTDKGATRAEIMEYVSSVLPATKNEEQKYKHLSNILKEMKGKRLITSNGKHWWPNSAKPTEND